MAGRPALIRNAHIEVHIPEDLYARLVLQLYSPAEGRVPRGSYSRFFTELLLEYFAAKELI